MEEWRKMSFGSEKRISQLPMPPLPLSFNQNNIWSTPEDELTRRSRGLSTSSTASLAQQLPTPISKPRYANSPLLAPSPFEEESILRMTHYEANYDSNYSLSPFASPTSAIPPWQAWDSAPTNPYFPPVPPREERQPRHSISAGYHSYLLDNFGHQALPSPLSLRSASFSGSHHSISSLNSLSDFSHSSTPSLLTPSTLSTADSSPKSQSPHRKLSHKHCSWCGHSGHQKQTCRDLTKAFKDGIVHARKGKICLGRPGEGGEPIPYPHGEKTLRDWVWKRREILAKERSMKVKSVAR